jgi:hypothetical protein
MSGPPDDEEVSIELGDWVQWHDQFHRANDSRLPVDHQLPIIQGIDLVQWIIKNQMGTPIH